MEKVNKILLELYNDRKQLLILGFLGYVSYLIEGIIPSDPNVIYATSWVLGITAVTMAGISLYGMIEGGKAMDDANEIAKDNQTLTAKIALENLAFQKEQQRALDKQKDIYRGMEFKNPYAEIENPFAGIQTEYENLFEDLKVDTLAAEFQAEQGLQQRADIMQGLRGAAGGAGIAGLAQTMAREGQFQTKQIAAGISQQEMINQRMKAQGALQAQQLEMQAETRIATGESAAQMARLGGEQLLQTMEMDRQATLLGIQMGQSAGANAALQQAYSNQLSAGAAMANMYGQQAAGMYGMAGQALGATATIAGSYAGAGG